HPLTRFAIKGVLWYQGESNCSNADTYFHKQRALIGSWRKAWNQGDFPFYFVQLANYGNTTDNPGADDGGWAKLRMAQLKSLTIPNTGMAVAIELADIGNPGDVHAKNKKDVGERLALWALARDYGKKNLVYSGPLYKGMKVEGAKIRITFDSVGSGLTIATKKGYDPMVKDPQGKLQKFAISGDDKKWVWADAVIDGKTVVVSAPGVPKPVAVRYAFASNPDGCNLYNNEGLPASPFRTDEW
ncbi:MAG: sialate O-acetylesterase, partial [Verrucomicrobiaceae bacterium]